MSNVIILDNGAGTVKAGCVNRSSSRVCTSPPQCFPNVMAKVGSHSSNHILIADQIEQFCQSSAGGSYLHYFRPFERSNSFFVHLFCNMIYFDL